MLLPGAAKDFDLADAPKEKLLRACRYATGLCMPDAIPGTGLCMFYAIRSTGKRMPFGMASTDLRG
eukprot:2929541-Rhodomonas_salina.5